MVNGKIIRKWDTVHICHVGLRDGTRQQSTVFCWKKTSLPIQTSFLDGIFQPATLNMTTMKGPSGRVQGWNLQWRNATRLCTSKRRDHQHCGAHCGLTLGYLRQRGVRLDCPKLGLRYEVSNVYFSCRVYYCFGGRQAIFDHPGLLIQWTTDQNSKLLVFSS